MGELENNRDYIERLVRYSGNDELDRDSKENVREIIEDMIESNEFNKILMRADIDPKEHADEINVNVKMCENLIRLLREARHVRFHRRRPEMLSRIASDTKPSLVFNPLNNKQPVWAIATSSDGTIIATAGASGEIKIWIRAVNHINEDEDHDDEDDEHESVCADDMDIIDWTPNVCKDVDMWQCVSSQRLIHSHNDWEDHQMLADSYVVVCVVIRERRSYHSLKINVTHSKLFSQNTGTLCSPKDTVQVFGPSLSTIKRVRSDSTEIL